MSAGSPPADDPDATTPRPIAPRVQPDVDLGLATETGTVGNRLAVGLRLDEYEISGVLGEGGFGIVYLAWDHSLQRRLAIKEYMPSSLAWRSQGLQLEVKAQRYEESFQAGLRSFINEAKLLARFDHPALVKVHRFWQANGTAYMVMPYYDGITLKEALAEMKTPPDETWLRDLLAPLLDALEYLHDASCFHRDIAPDNILLIDDGRPLLLDFGAARRVIGDMTKAVTVILKPGYAPIEQYGDMPGIGQGAWTDIYALGAVLHTAIMGEVPRPSVARLMMDDYVPLADRARGRYSDRLLRTIDRMLQVRPEDRPQTIARLRDMIAIDREQETAPLSLPPRVHRTLPPVEPPTGSQRSVPPLAKPPQPMPAVPRRWRPTPLQAALAGAGLLGAVGFGWWLSSPTRPAPEPAAPVQAEPASAPAASAPVIGPAASAVVEVPPAPAASAATPPPPPYVPAPVPEPAPTPTPVPVPAPPAAPVPVPAPPPVVPAPVPVPAPAPASKPAASVPATRASALKPLPTRRSEVTRPPVTGTAPAPAEPRIPSNARCAEIIQRVSIGETLTAADRRILKEECGR